MSEQNELVTQLNTPNDTHRLKSKGQPCNLSCSHRRATQVQALFSC